ncbi:transcription initiation factor TFIID subunit A-domain-containing protein [Panaeolus papilionaceus]|nr:transcription initiation factor TFIID subunit A-domain-containing protein [Panaeolus papilionaceus]
MSEQQNAAAGPSSSTAAQQPSTPTSTAAASDSTDVIRALGNLLKSQTGETHTNERISSILLSNMANLVQQGKLTQKQIIALKEFADQHKPANAQASASFFAGPGASTVVANAMKAGTPTHLPSPTPYPTLATTGLKSTSTSELMPAPPPSASVSTPTTSTAGASAGGPNATSTLNATNPGPVPWTPTRPTLSGGIYAGRMSGTPAQIARANDDPSILLADDSRSRRKSTPGDQSMRRTIQDLVASVDPNVKIEPEVEDLLLNIADEFIDSVTNFACRLAKHRGGDTLEVRDLQLHLERNHNIRIPGFASDETRISLSQSTIAPAYATTINKKNAQGSHVTLRAQRLAQVQQAKREGKLM